MVKNKILVDVKLLCSDQIFYGIEKKPDFFAKWRPVKVIKVSQNIGKSLYNKNIGHFQPEFW